MRPGVRRRPGPRRAGGLAAALLLSAGVHGAAFALLLANIDAAPMRPPATGGPFPIAWLGEPAAPARAEEPGAEPAPARVAAERPTTSPPASEPQPESQPQSEPELAGTREPAPAALRAAASVPAPPAVASGSPAAAEAGAPGPARRGPFGEDEVDRVAEPLDPPRPTYPRSERLLGVEADVVLALVVGVDGRVEAAEVVESAGERFDRASLDAARRARFRPARAGGRPVASRVTYTVRYRLDG